MRPIGLMYDRLHAGAKKDRRAEEECFLFSLLMAGVLFVESPPSANRIYFADKRKRLRRRREVSRVQNRPEARALLANAVTNNL